MLLVSPVTGLHWEQSGSVFFIPPHQVLLYTKMISLSIQCSQGSCLLWQQLQVFNLRCSPLLDSLQHVHLSVLLWVPRLDKNLQMHLMRAEQNHLPWPAENTLFNTAQETSCLLCREGALLAHRQYVVHPNFWIIKGPIKVQTVSFSVLSAPDLTLSLTVFVTTRLHFQDFSYTTKVEGLFWRGFLVMELCFRKLCLVLVIVKDICLYWRNYGKQIEDQRKTLTSLWLVLEFQSIPPLIPY